MTKFLPLNFFEFVVDKCEFFGYNSKSKTRKEDVSFS